MSISRKNWSALSSLTRQWTMEDEEEVERERRRKIRTCSTEPGDSPTEDVPPVFTSSEEVAEAGDPEAPVDFVEMLRLRDERRRKRLMEVVRQQYEEEEGLGAGQEAKVGVDRSGRNSEPTAAPSSASDVIETGSPSGHDVSESSQRKNAETPKKPSRLFVSSLSISIDKSPSSPTESGRVVSPISPTFSTGRGRVVSPLSSTSNSRAVSPLSPTSSTSTSRVVSPLSPTSSRSSSRVVSPLSPTGSFRTASPEERAGSPAPRNTCPVTQNGETPESQNASSAAGVTGRPLTQEAPFLRNSSKALSFRMARKKEEPSKPLQRSASVRITSKATQASKAPGQEEDKQSPFQRNSRQRISSRNIQEKMERLAMAVQKSEVVKSPSVSHKGLYVLADEVSRKRGLFERDPATGDGSPGAFRQDFRAFSAGISDRINRWVAKAQGPGSHLTPADFRNVDIASKRNIWENRAEEPSPKTPSYK